MLTNLLANTLAVKPRFQQVTGPGFRFVCIRCGGPGEFDPFSNLLERNILWADLNGPAFKAFYHGNCRVQAGLESGELQFASQENGWRMGK